jgi:hypothetical protein
MIGDLDKVSIVGYAAFSPDGQEYRLDGETDECGR